MKYDVFISHASEDKDSFVRPLAILLRLKGHTVWYDEFELKPGDSLRKSIDIGLSNSNIGIVILSHAFFKKKWTEYELNSLNSIALQKDNNVIIPIWYNVTKEDVLNFSPFLADKVAITSSLTLGQISERLSNLIKMPPNVSEYESICERCGKMGVETPFIDDFGELAWMFNCPHCNYTLGEPL